MLVRWLDRSSELLELLSFSSRQIKQPLTSPVTVGIPTATTTMTITTHSLTSAIEMALGATRALPSASAPQSTIATHTAYAKLAYLPYAGHALQAILASAHPIHEAVEQSTCTSSVRVYSEALCRSGWHGWHARVREQVVRAKWDGYAGIDGHFEHTILDGLDAGIIYYRFSQPRDHL